jgi:hypothetical protein
MEPQEGASAFGHVQTCEIFICPFTKTYITVLFIHPTIFNYIKMWKYVFLSGTKPNTVAAWSKAGTVFSRCNAGIVGSKPTQGMDVCARLFCVCAVLCIGSGLTTG